jgi:hypothetical protein
MTYRHLPATALIVMAMLALTACQTTPEETAVATTTESVVAEAAGVSIALLPEGFAVVTNDPKRFEMAADPATGGSVSIVLGETEPSGVNIVEAVKSEIAAFEALPDGQSFGQNQLIAPIGLTYVVRGRYTAAAGTTEELRALVVHTWGNRLLTVVYGYPLGDDTSERAAQLMELLGEIEPLDEPGAELVPVES